MSLSVVPIDVPTCGDLRRLREELGLSQSELASTLGFGLNGNRTVRDWEDGFRAGQPFKPTPTAWAALRYLLMLVSIYRAMDPEQAGTSAIRRLLPECVR